MPLFSDKNLIYKFVPVNGYTLKNLILKKLWFNHVNQVNDVQEGLIKFVNFDFSPSKKSIDNFLKKYNLDRDYVNWFLKNFGFVRLYLRHWHDFEISKFRISCFSKINNNPLMWAHYADKHKGICLVYDKNILLKNIKVANPNVDIMTVEYGIKPNVKLSENKNNISFEVDRQMLSTKDKVWRYEKEVRLYYEVSSNSDEQSLRIGASPLKAVIYGATISNDDRDTISEIILKDFEYSNVLEYSSYIDLRTGNITIEKD
jgi:hypothetical protein